MSSLTANIPLFVNLEPLCLNVYTNVLMTNNIASNVLVIYIFRASCKLILRATVTNVARQGDPKTIHHSRMLPPVFKV